MTNQRSALHLLASLRLVLFALAAVTVTVMSATSGLLTDVLLAPEVIGNGIWSN